MLSGSCFESNVGADCPISGSLRSAPCDMQSSPHSHFSLSQIQSADVFYTSPLSPSDQTRDSAQRFLPRSKLGVSQSLQDGGMPEFGNGVGFDFPSELSGLPIPAPRKSYCSSSTDTIVGSPGFSDANGVGSPIFSDALTALQKFLPSNHDDEEAWPVDAFPAMDVYSCDDFRMYEFKVRRCMRGRSHDWTECPFAHPGEKARRRDPRRIHYSGTACPDFRKGSCKRGDTCEYAHGVFECWLHPARYRTQPCKDGRNCRRRVCFFAHTMEQLRVLPPAATAASVGLNSPSRKAASSYDGSPLRQAVAGAILLDGYGEGLVNNEDAALQAPRLLQKVMDNGYGGCYGVSSPTSTLVGHSNSPPPLSPPLSPSSSPPMSPEPSVCWPRSFSTQSHPHSPLSNTSPIPAHRRHLNRLQSVPTISIPPTLADLTEAAAFDEYPFSSPTSQSPHAVNELLCSLQSLQLRSRMADLQRASSSPATPQSHKWALQQPTTLRHCYYRNIPGTSKDVPWVVSEPDMEAQPLRVESGRDLRANFYGKIGKENGVESSEAPDLGWVNELVK